MRREWIVLTAIASQWVVLESSPGGEELATVAKALPFLESEGEWWITEKKCVSCHHSTFLLWAKDLALDAGLDVNETTLEDQRKWVVESLLESVPVENGGSAPVIPDEKNGHRNIEGVSQLLVSPSAGKLSAETRLELTDLILSKWKESGIEVPGGQLPRQKRPPEETRKTSNQWALSALGRPAEGDPEVGAISSEWYAMNVVLKRSKAAVDLLLSRQNDDGGWSWLDGEPSSSMATGQALFALGRSGFRVEQKEAIHRAVEYLKVSQNAEGSWKTMGTKNRGKSDRISDFWGTAWAVIGILEATGSSEAGSE
jgi:hypothetical protein